MDDDPRDRGDGAVPPSSIPARHADGLPDRIAGLAEFGEHLARAPFDRTSLLDTVVRQVAATVGEACGVFLLDPLGTTLELVAVHHPDPRARDLAIAMFAEQPHGPGEGLLGGVLQSGAPVTFSDLGPELLDTFYADTGYSAFYHDFPVRSLVAVPMHAHTKVIGALVVFRGSAEHPYDADEVAYVIDLAERASIAVHNVQLMEDERDTAVLLHAVVDTAPDPILVVDDSGLILMANRATARVFGHAPEDLVRRPLTFLMPDTRSIADLHERIGGSGQVEGRRSDGSVVPLELSLSSVEIGGRTVFTGVVHDLTPRRRIEARLRELANTDPLTGLANRSRFRHHLDRATRVGEPFAVLFVDLDNFKAINDEWGHDTGDRLLTNVAKRISGCAREADQVARWGGDEFIVLAGIGDEREAESLADRIVEALSRPVTAYGHRFMVTASIGLALFPGDDRSPNRLIHLADAAMYRAKSEGAGRWARSTPDLVSAPGRRPLPVRP